MLNKKALSPLIATMLLLSVSLALGAIVMNWGRNYVADEQLNAPNGDRLCEQYVSLRLVRMAEKPLICHTDNRLSFIIENLGVKSISKMQVSVLGSDDVFSASVTDALEPAAITKITIPNVPALGTIQEVYIRPVIKHEGADIVCWDSIEPIREIGGCTDEIV